MKNNRNEINDVTPETIDNINLYPTHSEYPILATLKEVEFVGYESGKVGTMVRQI